MEEEEVKGELVGQKNDIRTITQDLDAKGKVYHNLHTYIIKYTCTAC